MSIQDYVNEVCEKSPWLIPEKCCTLLFCIEDRETAINHVQNYSSASIGEDTILGPYECDTESGSRLLLIFYCNEVCSRKS